MAYMTWLLKYSVYPAVLVTWRSYTQKLQFSVAATAATLCNFMECVISKIIFG